MESDRVSKGLDLRFALSDSGFRDKTDCLRRYKDAQQMQLIQEISAAVPGIY
jgi:hypothetical protein